jgi:hypothetical protein
MGELGDVFELVVKGPPKLRSIRAECHQMSRPGTLRQYRVWWEADGRLREEGRDDRETAVMLHVRDGARWWRWHKARGAVTNTLGDPKERIEAQIASMLLTHGRIAVHPDAYIDRRESIAGREAIVLSLREREIAVDAKHGVALRSVSPGGRFEVTEIAFDVPIPPDRFEFSPPAGVELRAASSNFPDPKPVAEIASNVDWQVFEPGPIVLGWPVDAVLYPAREDKPEVVSVQLRRAPISIHQSPSPDPESFGSRYAPEDWSQIVRDGVELEVREHPALVRLIRDEIHIEVSGEAANVEELITIALALRPVSRT